MEPDGAPIELGGGSGELAGTSGGLEGALKELDGASSWSGSAWISFEFAGPKSMPGCEEGLIFIIFGTLSKFGICIDGCAEFGVWVGTLSNFGICIGGCAEFGVWVLTSEGFAAGILLTHPSVYPRYSGNLGTHEPGSSANKNLSLSRVLLPWRVPPCIL